MLVRMGCRRLAAVIAFCAVGVPASYAHAQDHLPDTPPPEPKPTGTVRVAPELRAVVVDGAYFRAERGVAVVPCGRHHVKAGLIDAPYLDVPCGDTIWLVADASDPSGHRRETGTIGRVHAGIGLRHFYESVALGGDIAASLGLRIGRVNLYGDLHAFVGWAQGLPLQQFRVGPSVDLEAWPRLRLGGGLTVGPTTVIRATNHDRLSVITGSGRAFGAWDFFRTRAREAAFLLVELSADATLWGPTLAVGARFF